MCVGSLQIKPHPLGLFETLSKRRLFNRAKDLEVVAEQLYVKVRENRDKKRAKELRKRDQEPRQVSRARFSFTQARILSSILL